MRQPTPSERFLAWWMAALSGPMPPRQEGNPEAGCYQVRQVKGGPYVSLLILLDQVTDEEGELVQPETIRAELDGEPISAAQLDTLWLYARPITREDFLALRRIRREERHMAATRAPLNREALMLGPVKGQ